MAAEHYEDRLRRRAANMRTLASIPGASGPLRVWVELPVDDADHLAALVAAVREVATSIGGRLDGLVRLRTALAALDEKAGRG